MGDRRFVVELIKPSHYDERDRRPYADPALGLAAGEPVSRIRNKEPVAAAA